MNLKNFRIEKTGILHELPHLTSKFLYKLFAYKHVITRILKFCQFFFISIINFVVIDYFHLRVSTAKSVIVQNIHYTFKHVVTFLDF